PRVMEIVRLAQGLLQGSEVYLLTCEIIGETKENLANVTGWRTIRTASEQVTAAEEAPQLPRT
ncbi:MAG: hypothetical protein V3S37_03790, partial [Dehalococcoidia bacterium]